MSINKRWFAFFAVLILSACAIEGKHRISLDQVQTLGFTSAEIVQLGQLVQLAYVLFDDDESDANPKFPETFPAAYTPVANLQGRDDLSSATKEFYGHLSWKNDDPGTLVISIRGTSNAEEWLDDIKFEQVPYSDDPRFGVVELGFKEIFSSLTVFDTEHANYILLSEYLDGLAGVKKIIVVGHSLGSSLATLVAFEAIELGYAEQVQLLTFASPLTGNKTFVNAFQSRIVNSIRIVNQPDLVPRLPPEALDYRHIWHELLIDSDSDSSIDKSIICYHSLLTYLHVLDNSIKLAEKCQQ